MEAEAIFKGDLLCRSAKQSEQTVPPIHQDVRDVQNGYMTYVACYMRATRYLCNRMCRYIVLAVRVFGKISSSRVIRST